MITDNLYQQILIDPASSGNNELFIVSGYASATFLNKHISEITNKYPEIRLNLIIGMHQKRNDHSAYINIKNLYPNFHGYYYSGRPGVHSKTYCWVKDGVPCIGFSGSANYSQYGFENSMQQNQMVEDDPSTIKNYFQTLLKNSLKIEDYVPSEDDSIDPINVEGSVAPGSIEWIKYNDSARISLLMENGETASRAHLNWGQRPGREPNQAYLPIPKGVQTEGFLPERGYRFTLITDDKKTFDCVRAQDNGKAIETTNNNSELGKYLRNRLNLDLGSFVDKEDLIRYGRTDFLIRKLDDETFFFDFSKL